MILNIQVRDHDSSRTNKIIRNIEKYIVVEDWEIIHDTLWIRIRFEDENNKNMILSNVCNIILESNNQTCSVHFLEETIYA